MPDERQPPSRRSGWKALGAVAQTVGAVGFVVALLLSVAGFVVRARAVDRMEGIAGKIDDGVDKGTRLLAAARERADGASTVVAALGEAVRARAAEPSPALDELRERASDLSDKYLAMRATYAEAREKVVSVVDRLEALDAAVPAVSIPQGPVEMLASLDERARALDANVLELIDAVSEVGSGAVAETVAGKADATRATLQAVSARLFDTGARLDGLRREVAVRADRIRTALTIAAVVWMLACFYGAMLHGVLHRWGSRARDDAPSAR